MAVGARIHVVSKDRMGFKNEFIVMVFVTTQESGFSIQESE